MKLIIVNGILFVLFGLFAIVQINDPDPFLWVMIYGVTGVTALLRIFGIFQRTMVMIILVLIGIYALLHLPSFWYWLTHSNKSALFGEMIYDKPHIEGTREFLGLVIAAIGLGVQFILKPK